MARDRFIRWTTSHRPTRMEVEFVCTDYLAGLGTVEWRDGREVGVPRFYCWLPGASSQPLRRIGAGRPFTGRKTRWVEVIPSDHELSFDVITREQDAVTNAIADGLADVFARQWCGVLRP